MATRASDPDDEAEPTVQVVEFLIGGERFATDVRDVDSIEELVGSTRVPRTSDAIDGVMDLRGEIMAILDPRVHLDVDDDAEDAEPQVLVLDQSKDKQKIGVRVDRVFGVENYPESAVVDGSDLEELGPPDADRRAIKAIIRRPSAEYDFEPVGWIDVDELIELAREME